MVNLLVITDPTYEKYIHINKAGKRVLYVTHKKAVYGYLRAVGLFYENLAGQLRISGFEINRYGLYVANKTVNGKRCTAIRHVDYLRIPYKE